MKGGGTVIPVTGNILDDMSFQASIDLLALQDSQNPPSSSANQAADLKASKSTSNEMNRMIEDSMKLMAENKRVIQTVQDRMMNQPQYSQHERQPSTGKPPSSNSTQPAMLLETTNLSAIDPVDFSPHNFSMGSVSTVRTAATEKKVLLIYLASSEKSPLIAALFPPLTSCYESHRFLQEQPLRRRTQ